MLAKYQKPLNYDKSAFFLINILTLTRIPMTIFFVYFANHYIVQKNHAAGITALLISLMVMITDYVDGVLARKYNVVSEIGQKADVICDFFYIVISLLLFNYHKIIPLFITYTVTYKFIEFLLYSKLVDSSYKRKKGGFFLFDWLGQCVSVLYYLLPGFQIMALLSTDKSILFMNLFLYSILFLTFFSSAIKFLRYYVCKRGM